MKTSKSEPMVEGENKKAIRAQGPFAGAFQTTELRTMHASGTELYL